MCLCGTCSVEKESYDATQRVADLKNKLQQARERIDKLPGIDLSKEEQERQIEVLRQQLLNKTQLLKDYRDMSKFDVAANK